MNAQKVRRFCIAGDIQITEDIEFHELAVAREATAGRAWKESDCILNNEGSEDLGNICIDGVDLCPEEGGIGAGTPGTA